ncbi:MAG: hypothetical protein PUJ93_05635, partial [Oscillospiraceae bacterium]|nr:hypothetical protein [Oscillospiraceae bacterium]MDY5735670.1 hypothetical protein [Oscillospiraceae bacterium]
SFAYAAYLQKSPLKKRYARANAPRIQICCFFAPGCTGASNKPHISVILLQLSDKYGLQPALPPRPRANSKTHR